MTERKWLAVFITVDLNCKENEKESKSTTKTNENSEVKSGDNKK